MHIKNKDLGGLLCLFRQSHHRLLPNPELKPSLSITGGSECAEPEDAGHSYSVKTAPTCLFPAGWELQFITYMLEMLFVRQLTVLFPRLRGLHGHTSAISVASGGKRPWEGSILQPAEITQLWLRQSNSPTVKITNQLGMGWSPASWGASTHPPTVAGENAGSVPLNAPPKLQKMVPPSLHTFSPTFGHSIWEMFA